MENIGDAILDAFKWWEKRRLYFNILVGVTGLISVLGFSYNLWLFDYLGIIMWGVVANLLYSTGFVLETAICYYSKGRKKMAPHIRQLLWLMGTGAYMVVSFGFAALYFGLIPD